MPALPDCYGIYWEGLKGSACFGCGVKVDCLAKFATGTLMQHQQVLGDDATPEKLAERTGVKEEAILLAINFQKNVGLKSDQAAPAMTEPKTVSPPPPPTMPPDPDSKGDEAVAKPKKGGKKKSAKKKEAKPAKKPTKPKKAAPKKKPASKKKAAPANPPEARPAKPAKGRAKMKPGKSATTALAQAGERTWDPSHNETRWKRERKRSKAIGKLKLGQILEREWPTGSGNKHQVKVAKGKYLYLGQEYPTLYSIVKAITGTTPSPKQRREDGTRPQGKRQLVGWSAAKFFKLGSHKPKKSGK